MPLLVQSQKGLFFKIDTTSIDSVAFKVKPTGTYNNIVRLKNKKNIEFTVYTGGKGYSFKCTTEHFLPLNTLFIVPKERPEIFLRIKRGHSYILLQDKLSETPFELLIVSEGVFIDQNNQFHSTEGSFNQDLNANLNFFYFNK